MSPCTGPRPVLVREVGALLVAEYDQVYDRDYIRSQLRSMKFVTVRDLRGKTSELWKELNRARELVVTNNGKPIAILSATDEDSFESCLWALRRSRASDALGRLQRDAEARGMNSLTPEDIDAEIRKRKK